MEQHGDHLDDIAPYVEDSGEGRWTINEAINANVPVPAISATLFARLASAARSTSRRRCRPRCGTSSEVTP